MKVAIEKIVVKKQPRTNFDSVDRLAASIKAVGLIQPVCVLSENDTNDGGAADAWILVDGERRLRACKQLGMKEIEVTVSEAGSDHAAREIQMAANLEREDLSLIERMRGFVMLLENAPAKYNEKVIANRFGMKEKDVRAAVATARKLHPDLDLDLASGRFELDDFEELAKVPPEYQGVVVSKALQSNSVAMPYIITTCAHELIFDDVFKESEARAAGKLHYRGGWRESWYTFDEAYAAEHKKAYEARTKRKHDEDLAKQKKAAGAQKEISAEAKKKAREKEKKEKESALKGVKLLIEKAYNRTPSAKMIEELFDEQLKKFTKGDAKIILRAFGAEVKADETSDDVARKLRKALNGFLDSSESVVSLSAVAAAARYSQSAVEMFKKLSKGAR